MILPSGFEKGESSFQRWCDLLLLNAMQTCGWFRSAGDHANPSMIAEEEPEATLEMVKDLLQILTDAGFLQRSNDKYATLLHTIVIIAFHFKC